MGDNQKSILVKKTVPITRFNCKYYTDLLYGSIKF